MPMRAFVVVLPMLILSSRAVAHRPRPRRMRHVSRWRVRRAPAQTNTPPIRSRRRKPPRPPSTPNSRHRRGNSSSRTDRARELAVAATTAAEKAATDATSARERAEAEEARRAKAAAARRDKLAKAVRVGGQVRPPIRVKEVAPVYPAIAQSARVQGDVVIEATIDEEGKVADARVVKSVPLLDQAALDAVRQWEYRPSLLNGVPTAVVTIVTVKFTRP